MNWSRTVFSLLVAAGCSSASPPNPNPNPNPPQSTGDDLNKPNAVECAKAVDGTTCYPVANLGYVARRGTTPGNRMPNIRTIGYRNTNPASTKTASSGAMGAVQMSDYFDPSGTKYKLLRIVAGASWCGPCNLEADELVQSDVAGKYASQGVVIINALVDGPVPGTEATAGDLQAWIDKHALNFDAVLDGTSKFGPFWKANAFPETITVDARSMEILAEEVGYNQGKLEADVQKWLAWVNSNPAMQ